jgi:hypothetical protein
MHDSSFLEVTPSDCLRFVKTADKTVGYLYLRNKSEDTKLVLAKVSLNNQVDFMQAEAFRIEQTYIMLKPRQGVRLKIVMLENKINPDKMNTVRVQANELKRIALHKFDNENELREEWKTEKQHYEARLSQKVYIPCSVINKVQPQANSQNNYYSGKSMRSIIEEVAELSLYPQHGFMEERSIRSKNFPSSPGHLASSLKPLGPQQSNSRDEEHQYNAKHSLVFDSLGQGRASLGGLSVFPQMLEKPGRLSMIQTRSEEPGHQANRLQDRFSVPVRRVQTDIIEGEALDLGELPQSKKAEHSRTQPSTSNGRSRSRL